eukprot:CAMPEP_0119322292 /NCGR_PEP_ID=MMETSP1333-20130426/57740_1 /TAXON_ID=418940 /ORGANISM="Scyphosphaera apsteinii, Strain RCC1455" /LENGTH=320 /DNA_ID=CAMNT_0007329483 /DNA_START=23 /DNA_END=982 /DNA_ORIENTATION=+
MSENTPNEVGLAIRVARVYPPCMAEERYKLELDQFTTFADPSLRGRSAKSMDIECGADGKWLNVFDPKIKIRNELSTEEKSVKYFFKGDGVKLLPEDSPSPDGKVHIYKRLVVELTMDFNLRSFPFDRHLLKLNFGTYLPWHQVQFVPYPDRPTKIDNDNECSGWTVCPNALPEDSFMYILEYEDLPAKRGGKKYAQCIFFVPIQRELAWYMNNIFVPMLLIMAMSAIAFLVPFQDVADRMSITLTLFLTIVASKLIVVTELPKTNHLSLLDKYFMSAYALMSFSVVSTFLLNVFCNSDEVKTICLSVDWIAAGALYTLW